MTRRPIFLLTVLAFMAFPLSSFAAQTEEDNASAFIQDLGNKTIAAFSDKTITRSQAVDRFRGLLREGFDVPYIGRWVLGRFWNQATPEEQTEYQQLFEKLIVDTYAARFADYSGETFRVLGSRTEQNGDVMVQTQIVRPSGPPATVEWRVRNRNGQFHIIDVVVEGVSMGITQRSEFASVIQSSGSINGLLQALRKRVSYS